MLEHIFATLSLYARSSSDLIKFVDLMGMAPTRHSASEDGSLHSVHFSTEGFVSSQTADAHIEFLASKLQSCAAFSDQSRASLSRIVLWFYIEPSGTNNGFGLSPRTIEWIARVGAELYVDIWDGTE